MAGTMFTPMVLIRRPTLKLGGLLLAACLTLCLAACRAGAGESENVPGIPVYPGAELVDSTPAVKGVEPDGSDSRDPIDSYVVGDADVETVAAWYREQMQEHGWSPITEPDDTVVLYNDAQGCYAMVTVNPDDGGVFLQISRQDPGTPCFVVPTTVPGDE